MFKNVCISLDIGNPTEAKTEERGREGEKTLSSK